MSKDEIIKQLRDMAKHPTVTLPRDCDVLRAAADLLEQPEQEPVAWMYPDALCDRSCLYLCTKAFTQFPECATTPPQRKPLTDEQRKQMWHKAKPAHRAWASFDWYSQGVADTESAHGIKE